MVESDLQIEECEANADSVEGLQLKEVKQRIESLPALDVPVRINGLRALLDDVNQTELPAATLSELLELVDRNLGAILSGYK